MADARLASIHGLYMAMARGEVGGMTVPAFNLRGMTEELAQGIFEAAKETETGAFILEIARSEMGYTGQLPNEFVRRVLVGANLAGWQGPIFVQGDHSQAKAEQPGKIAEGEIEKIQKLIDVEMEAGFYNIDIDASTLVDVSLPTVAEQQQLNGKVTAELAQYIRQKQPKGVQVSIGGEIGHIGDKNSTREDLDRFYEIFRQYYPREQPGLSKISVQTGTSHGGRMQADGNLETMTVDFEVITELSRRAKELGMAGVVQHGASTLPESMYPEFPARGAMEIHLSTGWQNMIMDHPQFPVELTNKMHEWLLQEKGSERKVGETEAQFYYRTRKYCWGQFRSEFNNLDLAFKQTIKNEMRERCKRLFTELGVAGSKGVVEQYIETQNLKIKNQNQSLQLKTVEQVDVRGKRVVVRVDWNVTLGKALEIVDDTRIVRTLPTIKWLIEHGAKQIILMSHLGKAEEKRSLEPVVEYSSRLVGDTIKFKNSIEECHSDTVSRIIMLENLRWWEGEEKNDPEYAKQLASLGDIYVNEAFGESHREAASIVGIAKYLPSYAGMWLAEEVETILKVRNNPERPMVVVMGGAKVTDKLALLQLLAERADTILVGGKLANEYVAQGIRLLGRAKILLPVEGANLLDIGEETQKIFVGEIAQAKTVVWNGPMGKIEEAQYRAGTDAIFEAICANEAAYTLVGGGDTLAAVGREEHLTRIDHVSTGGGAMLALLEKGSLPGIEVLLG